MTPPLGHFVYSANTSGPHTGSTGDTTAIFESPKIDTSLPIAPCVSSPAAAVDDGKSTLIGRLLVDSKQPCCKTSWPGVQRAG
jgi:hypothetical protein